MTRSAGDLLQAVPGKHQQQDLALWTSGLRFVIERSVKDNSCRPCQLPQRASPRLACHLFAQACRPVISLHTVISCASWLIRQAGCQLPPPLLRRPPSWQTPAAPPGLPVWVRARQHRVCSRGCPNGTESLSPEAVAWGQDKTTSRSQVIGPRGMIYLRKKASRAERKLNVYISPAIMHVLSLEK